MNTHDTDPLERMIADLPWRGPSRALDARVDRALSRKRFGFGALAAAASVGLLVGLGVMWGATAIASPHAADPVGRPSPVAPVVERPPAPERFDAHRTVAYAPTQVGTVQIPGAPPMRLVRQPYLDHRAWYDHETGGTFEVTEPKTQFLFVSDSPY